MKIIKHLSFIILLSLVGCATNSNYTKNNLKNEYFKDKTIVFTLNENSKKSVSYSGPRAGYERQPDVKEAFKIAIEELAKETKLDLKFNEGNSVNKNEIIVDSEITEILWAFDLSSATMKTSLNYTLKSTNKIFKINGIYKNMSGGTEKGNLIRSLKIANYSFLKELEK
ncbi:MAG: hypothetical protein PSX42_03380 [bacterium]|nr:hypothetical protein [bacterium]